MFADRVLKRWEMVTAYVVVRAVSDIIFAAQGGIIKAHKNKNLCWECPKCVVYRCG